MIKQCLSGRNLETCGRHKNFRQDKRGQLVLAEEQGVGIFVSRTYDSGKEGTEWNRIVMNISRNGMLDVYVFLFDDYTEGEEIDHTENVLDQYRIMKEKAQYTSHYREMLLYGEGQGKGRYAKLAVEIMAEVKQNGLNGENASSRKVILKGYAMSFPKESFASYLPAVYQGNEQLDRFLAVHQSLYLELEQKIDLLAHELDYELCRREQLAVLARWLGWGELADTADEDILRQLLGTGLFLLSRKGSKEYYERLAEILTGQEAVLLEEVEKNKNLLLIIRRPKNGREKYLEWLRRNIPIGIHMDIEILHRTNRLDGQFFLDYTAAIT